MVSGSWFLVKPDPNQKPETRNQKPLNPKP